MINQITDLSQLAHGSYINHNIKPLFDSFNIQQKMKQSQHCNQKKMKQLVEEMRFKQKMQTINRKKGRYKRSTNNCHKKYIGILKNLLFLKLSNQLKNEILNQFNQFKNSRVYYFIILCYLKWYLTSNEIRWVFQHFCKQVENKITRYQIEIQTTDNTNFINFRKDQIIEMQYSIHSINYFLRDKIEQSIKMLYQKNKYIIIKRNQYLRTTKIVEQLEKTLNEQIKSCSMKDKLENLQLEEIYIWKNQNIIHDKYRNQVNRHYQQHKDKSELYQPENEEFSSRNHENSYEEPKNNIVDKPVKLEENRQFAVIDQFMPLIGLQNSYPAINEAYWFNWIAHKQKQMQMYMRFKEEGLARIYASNRIHFNRQSSWPFPSI